MRGKFVLGVLILTVALAGVGFWFWQQNTFSTGTLKLEILAPEEITMGEEITYVVKWKNNGEIELENAELVFEYPQGSQLQEGENLRVTKTLDDINPGQETSARFVARMFGKENELKEAKAFLSYTPRNLNAEFRSETTSTSKITFVPLNFQLDMPSRIETGQEFTITMNYFSNVNYPLTDLRIQVEYPQGFTFRRATPAPIGESEWDIGVLNQTEGDRITITGVLDGNVGEVQNVRAVFGSWKEGIFTTFHERTKAVQITKPRLLITQRINATEQYRASVGDSLHYEIFFKNPTDRVLENLFLIVNLEGRGFDLESVRPIQGKFQQGDNSILWEAKNVPKLRFLGTGEEGRVEFWVNVKDEIETFSPQDQELVLKDRVVVSEAVEEFEVKLQSDLRIEQTGFFEDEVFGNQGAHPLQVGRRNTYTIIWRATNRYNNVGNARVKATLPIGVELTGKIFPEDGELTYDSNSREVVWEIGDMPAGTGILPELPAPSIAFQIGFTPTVFHNQTTPTIIEVARITGEDGFIEDAVSGLDDLIDTTLPDDPSVSTQDGLVQ